MRITEDGFSRTSSSGYIAVAIAALLCLTVLEVRAEDHDVEALRWVAQGDQIYRCRHDSGLARWVLERPAAVLHDKNGTVTAEHGAGPVWRASDGSEVQGVVVTAIPAPKSGAIAWLVLRVSHHAGHGLLDGIAYILRTDTEGGVAPETGCDTAQSGHEVAVPYRATYTFIAGSGTPAVQ
jgi:Protein of unknown function (DUF3455)